MGYFDPIRPITLSALFLWLLVTILLISATGDPKYLSGGGSNLGAFQICNSGGGSCYNINTNCQWTINSYTYTLDGSCSQFQAFRAFLIMGLLLAIGITIAVYAIFFLHQTANRSLNVVILVLSLVESLFIMIAFSVFAGWVPSGSPSKSDSFGLLVSGWVFGLIAMGLWWAGCVYEVEGVGGTGRMKSTDATMEQAAPTGSGVGMQQMPPAQAGYQQQTGYPAAGYPQQPQQPSYMVPPPVYNNPAVPPASGGTAM